MLEGWKISLAGRKQVLDFSRYGGENLLHRCSTLGCYKLYERECPLQNGLCLNIFILLRASFVILCFIFHIPFFLLTRHSFYNEK